MMTRADIAHLAHRDVVVRSIDRAVGRLLDGGDDPLALSLSLWVVRSHDLVLVNGDALAAWASAWVVRILVDGQVGRRKDIEIASAALAAISLQGSDVLADRETAVRKGLKRAINDEIDRRGVPFGSAAYAAIFLLAVRLFAVDEPRLPDALRSVADLYERALSGGRAFGLGFVVSLLRGMGDTGRADDLACRARVALGDPRTGYEDQIYLVQALWVAKTVTGDDDLVDMSARLLVGSPGLAYIGQGAEDIDPAGEENTVIPVSHLYRAMLLDVILRTEQVANKRAATVLDERYRGRRAVTMAAFGAYLVPVVLVWFAVGDPLVVWRNAAEHFWIDQQFMAMSVWGALLYSLDVAILTLLIPCTGAVIGALWDVLIRAHTESDRRLQDVVWPRLLGAIVQWKLLFAIAFVVSVVVGFALPGLAHILHRLSAP